MMTITILFFFDQTDGLVTCIECDTETNPLCFDDFGKDKRNETKSCRGTACFKRKIIDHEKNLQSLKRGCKIKVKGDENDCSKKEYHEGSKSKKLIFAAHYCVCNKDYCNSSRKFSLHYLLIIGLVITTGYNIQ